MDRYAEQHVHVVDGREPVAHRVVRRLQEMISHRDFKPGALLPAQRTLALELGVSRSSLREALSVMETLGLVSGEPGQRTRVLGASADRDKISRRWRYASRYSEKDVFEVRLLLETRAARLAAERVSPESLAELATCLALMKSAIHDGDLLTASRRDFEFHGIIITLSGNRLFKEIHDMNREAILASQQLPLARHNRLWEPVREHASVLGALEQRDPDGSAYLMQLHIIRAADRIGIRLEA
ncbi:MAG: FadR/GntR family transcriptional regulator [Acetobacteraceae bacterium]